MKKCLGVLIELSRKVGGQFLQQFPIQLNKVPGYSIEVSSKYPKHLDTLIGLIYPEEKQKSKMYYAFNGINEHGCVSGFSTSNEFAFDKE